MRLPASARLGFALLLPGVLSCHQAARRGSPTIAPRDSAVLTDSMLGQLSYPNDIVAEGRVRLHDGDWQSDSTSLDRASAHLAEIAHGELSNDGHRDAVVVLVTVGGGTGRFLDLIPVLATADGPRVGRATSLGDRVLPESLWVAGGRAHLRIVTHDSTDGLCCPTRRELQVYRLLGDSLMLERAEFVGRVPPELRGD